MQTINELQCKKQKVFSVGFWLLFRLVISREQTVTSHARSAAYCYRRSVVSVSEYVCLSDITI